MPNTTGITVSFACPNSAMAAKMIEYFDRLSAESMQQMCDSLRDHPGQWTEFAPDGTSKPATEPLYYDPPHVSHPNSSSVPQNAASSAPAPYQQSTPSAPPAPSVSNQPPAPQPMPSAQAQTPPQSQPQTYQQQQPAVQSAPQSEQQPNYQQTAMTYTPAPTNHMPAASAPVIKRDQLMNALQLFASSSQARQLSIRDLLARFSVDSINALPDAALPEFANSLRELGCFV